jgi:hypothetical protein
MAGAAFEKPVTDSVAKIDGELAVGEDLNFQRRWWRFERAVWVFFVAVIALDLAGAFGRGPLANAAASSSDHSIDATYERIERVGTPSLMTIRIKQSPSSQPYVELFVSDTAVSGLGLQRVIPAPQTTSLGGGGLTYRFPIGPLPAVVRLEFEPVSAGFYQVAVGTPGRAPIPMTVAVVP